MALREPVLTSHGKLKSIPTVNECSPNTGLTFSDTEIFAQLIGEPLNPSISCAEASLARISASPEKALDSPANAADSGSNTLKRSKPSRRVTSSSKTSPPFALADWIKYSGRSLRSGMMRNGIVYPLMPLVPLTGGIGSGLLPTPQSRDHFPAHSPEYIQEKKAQGHGMANLNDFVAHHHLGLWPTPRARDWKGQGMSRARIDAGRKPDCLDVAVKFWPTPASNNGTGGCTGLAGGSGNRKKLYAMLGEEERKKLGCQSLNPYWVEWLMGYPIGWTDLRDSATPLSRKSRK